MAVCVITYVLGRFKEPLRLRVVEAGEVRPWLAHLRGVMSRLPPPTRCTTFLILLSCIPHLRVTSFRGGVVGTSTRTYGSSNSLAYFIRLYIALVLGGEDLQALTLKLCVAPCRR